jgi:hypothetical protein
MVAVPVDRSTRRGPACCLNLAIRPYAHHKATVSRDPPHTCVCACARLQWLVGSTHLIHDVVAYLVPVLAHGRAFGSSGPSGLLGRLAPPDGLLQRRTGKFLRVEVVVLPRNSIN